MPSVLQPWLEELPIRMQSTLLLGLRGPDGYQPPNIKLWIRWLRGLAFRPGNPYNVREFMNTELPPKAIEKSPIARELETLPMHFYSHLMHSIEVVGYQHPNPEIGAHALNMFYHMANLLHLPVEPADDFANRLRRIPWPGGVEPFDAAEAIQIMDNYHNALRRDEAERTHGD